MDTPVETPTAGNITEADHVDDTARIARDLADRHEVAELLTRGGRLLDEGRHRDARSIYTDDVVVRSPRGGTLRGIDEVIAFLEASPVEGERTQHVHTDVLVDLDGDRAEVSANTFTHFYRDGAPPTRLAACGSRAPPSARRSAGDSARSRWPSPGSARPDRPSDAPLPHQPPASRPPCWR
jgi:hypothetical protein